MGHREQSQLVQRYPTAHAQVPHHFACLIRRCCGCPALFAVGEGHPSGDCEVTPVYQCSVTSDFLLLPPAPQVATEPSSYSNYKNFWLEVSGYKFKKVESRQRA